MNRARGQNGLFACPCCGFATLGEVAGYEICHICFWEDDGQDDPEVEENWGGPNHVSLVQARRNFLEFGAAESKDLKHCRKPEVSDEQVRIFILEGETVTEKSRA